MDTLTKILSLISVAIILYYYYDKWVKYNEELQKKTWPLRYPDCPDYWELTENGSCRNKFALGSCPELTQGLCVPNTSSSTPGTDLECRVLTKNQCGSTPIKNKSADSCEFDNNQISNDVLKNFNEETDKSLENKTEKSKQIALKRRGQWARSCNVTWEGIDKLPAPDANDGLE
tara:strand:+ start:1071 stop:1592 length:522 start_codon:yes stop_codon:yes gene_type:complete